MAKRRRYQVFNLSTRAWDAPVEAESAIHVLSQYQNLDTKCPRFVKIVASNEVMEFKCKDGLWVQEQTVNSFGE